MENNELNNFRSAQDFVDNYSAGQQLRKRSTVVADTSKSAEVGFKRFISSMTKLGRRQHMASNPIVPNMADYVNWIYYDRYVTAAGGTIPTQFSLFTVPMNQGGKTKVDTNLSLVSQLPQPYWMNVTHMGFYMHPNTLEADIINFWNQAYFEFWVNNKIYIEGPYQCFPGAAGLHGATTNTGQQALSSGNPMVGNLYDLRLPAGINLGNDANTGGAVVTDGITGINILQSQNFFINNQLPGGALTLTASNATPNPGTGLSLYVFMHGILSRSVQ